MLRRLVLWLMIGSLVATVGCTTQEQERYALVPWPEQLEERPGAFVPDAETQIAFSDPSNEEVRVVVSAGALHGLFYGMQTLRQLLPPEAEEGSITKTNRGPFQPSLSTMRPGLTIAAYIWHTSGRRTPRFPRVLHQEIQSTCSHATRSIPSTGT